jgi:hypothetical protein
MECKVNGRGAWLSVDPVFVKHDGIDPADDPSLLVKPEGVVLSGGLAALQAPHNPWTHPAVTAKPSHPHGWPEVAAAVRTQFVCHALRLAVSLVGNANGCDGEEQR